MEYEIELDNNRVEAMLVKLQGELLKWDVAMYAIGQAYKQYMATKPFASRGSIFGQAWPALNASYNSWKAKAFPGRPILVRSGDLARGFDFLSTSDMVKVFNTVSYFEKHQKGEGVPQRVSMAYNTELKQMANNLVAQDLQRKMKDL